MRLVALLLAFCTEASAFTMTPHGGGITLLICDDVAFTHYGKPEGGIVHGREVKQGAFVLTCPRTNATWDLVINDCVAHQVKTISVGNYQLTC
jgi:predicted Rdx family selenoprotein